MATLKDLSKALNLSVTQVSRALNGHSDVSDQTRLRVEQAAKDLNYQPNVAARSLVSGRSGMVGLVLHKHATPSIAGILLKTVEGLSELFSSCGLQLMLHIAPRSQSIIETYQRLIDRCTFDGFILLEPCKDDLRIAYLLERDIPFVVHGRGALCEQHAYYDIDNEGTAYQSTRYLIQKGHKRIAMVQGEKNLCYVIDRMRGYRKALEENHIEFQSHLLHTAPMTEANGMIAAVKLLEKSQQRPTAIVCGNVLIAKAVYNVANAMALSIPDELSIIAHDDVFPEIRASAFYPALSVTRSPLSYSWQPLTKSLAIAIEGGDIHRTQQVAGFDFVERSSVAQAPISETLSPV